VRSYGESRPRFTDTMCGSTVSRLSAFSAPVDGPAVPRCGRMKGQPRLTDRLHPVSSECPSSRKRPRNLLLSTAHCWGSRNHQRRSAPNVQANFPQALPDCWCSLRAPPVRQRLPRTPPRRRGMLLPDLREEAGAMAQAGGASRTAASSRPLPQTAVRQAEAAGRLGRVTELHRRGQASHSLEQHLRVRD
jgi:hypothetical protein